MSAPSDTYVKGIGKHTVLLTSSEDIGGQKLGNALDMMHKISERHGVNPTDSVDEKQLGVEHTEWIAAMAAVHVPCTVRVRVELSNMPDSPFCSVIGIQECNKHCTGCTFVQDTLPLDSLSKDVQEKLSMLMLTDGSNNGEATSDIEGVGRRISDRVFWVYSNDTFDPSYCDREGERDAGTTS